MSEAVVFKKKGRRNFRRKNVADENEEEGELEQATESKSVEKEGKKLVKSAPKTLLSFDQHGDDGEFSGEVFKVKKSKESRKLSKQRFKAKKTKDEKPEPESVSTREDTEERLESLREELSNLGDEEDQEEEKSDEEIKMTEFRTPDVTLNDGNKSKGSGGKAGHSFHIPDAAAIHAARKTREMARQLGNDYVPLDDTTRYSGRFDTADKSRLVREDDNDQSDEEQDGPLGFGTRKSITQPALQRRLEVEQALAKESDDEANSEDEDDALKRFEDEQIRKGVSIPQAQQEEDPAYTLYVQQVIQDSETNPTNFPQASSAPYFDQTAPISGYTQTNYPPVSLSTVTMDMVWEKMNNRIVSLQEVHRGRRLEKDKILSQLDTSETSIVSLEKQMGDAEGRFGFFQEMRGYVRDLIECLNEKVPVIENLETRMHSLLKQKSERLVERRQQDVKDQAEDFAIAQAGKPVQPKAEFDEFGRDKSMYADQGKQRRFVERDARRNRRKRERESVKQDDEDKPAYHEGLSSDDEEGSGDILWFKDESEKIMDEAKGIFGDVLEDFSTIDSIKSRFQVWKYGFPETYKQAFIHLCLPKLLLPFVKIELLTWNPLKKGCKDFEEMSWFESLMFYGFHDNSYDPDDEDTNLIPRMTEKALLPKLTGLLEQVWDPLSLKETILTVNLIKRLVVDYPTVSAEKKSTQELFNTVITRIKKCINDDVFVPLYPKSLFEKKTMGVDVFVERQFWSCLKLFGNILLWNSLISPSKLQELGIDGLLNRYLLLALQHASNKPYENLTKSQAIVSVLPKEWFQSCGRTTLNCLASFARYLENLANVLKMRAEGSNQQEKKKARSGIKKIISILMQMYALDKAEGIKASS